MRAVRGRHRIITITDRFFWAIANNDLAEFKALIEAGTSVNTKNSFGCMPLTAAIDSKSEAIFDYLLSLDGVDIEVKAYHRTPLLLTAFAGAPARFARKLITKGADVHARDDSGFTYLHLATWDRDGDTLEVGKTVIEMGTDVNARSCRGLTPLYLACQNGNFEWASMLLYYGADASIPSAEGVLPLAAIASIPLEEELELGEVLFNYTFDGLDNRVQLSALVHAMKLDSAIFRTIVDSDMEVVYDFSDLAYLYSKLPYLNPSHFRIFVEKYGHIVKEMIEMYHPIMDLLDNRSLRTLKLMEILDVFLESDCADMFVQTADPSFPAVSNLVRMFNSGRIVVEEKVAQIVLLMVSHGLKIFSEDLDTIYRYYGWSELFKILLHMDIEVIHSGQLSAAALYYDFNINLEPKKELCMKRVKDMVKKLPLVPRLTELSRNVARRYIIKRFNVKNSMQFYTIVKWLPIGEMTKLIITLEKELY